MYHGIPWPKKVKGVKYQGSGWRDLNKSSKIFVGSLVETIGSSSSSETSSSIEIRWGGRLSVMTSFTRDESGWSRISVVVDVWISGSEISYLGSSIFGSEMGFLSEDSPVSDSVWTSLVICKLVVAECDVKLWVWSNSIYVTSRPKIVDVISWLTSIPLTSKSIIIEVLIYVVVLDPDDLNFLALIFSSWLGVYSGGSLSILHDYLGNFATMENFQIN